MKMIKMEIKTTLEITNEHEINCYAGSEQDYKKWIPLDEVEDWLIEKKNNCKHSLDIGTMMNVITWFQELQGEKDDMD